MDIYDKATRSYVMSRIRKRDTKAEVRLRQALWGAGLRGYRLHTLLPGRPDIVYTQAGLAIFVDGCFWHRCPYCKIPTPKSNRQYWASKLRRNCRRDKRVRSELESLGWRLLQFWEHEVQSDAAKCVRRVVKALSNREPPQKNRSSVYPLLQ